MVNALKKMMLHLSEYVEIILAIYLLIVICLVIGRTVMLETPLIFTEGASLLHFLEASLTIAVSIEFLKMLLGLAREAAQAEKEVVPEEEVDKGKAALTELFNGVKNTNTPVIVERIVTDIDDIVKIVRFDGWQNTTGGRQEVKKALRSVVWVKYKIKDKEVFDKAYSYIEQYY